MVRQSAKGPLIPDTRPSSWRKSSILTDTWQGGEGLKLPMHFAWQRDRSRSGFRTVGWSGRRNTRWPVWMPCQCIKCILHWLTNTQLIWWACTNLLASTTWHLNTCITTPRPSSTDIACISRWRRAKIQRSIQLTKTSWKFKEIMYVTWPVGVERTPNVFCLQLFWLVWPLTRVTFPQKNIFFVHNFRDSALLIVK